MYDQFNCADYGDERPGGHLSAGIDREAFSKEQAPGEGMICAQDQGGQSDHADRCSLITAHCSEPSTEFNPC